MAITRVNCAPLAPGRVVLGPRKLGPGYYRIVAAKGGAGCIQQFDPSSRAWSPAPESVTFADVWSAPLVPSGAPAMADKS